MDLLGDKEFKFRFLFIHFNTATLFLLVMFFTDEIFKVLFKWQKDVDNVNISFTGEKKLLNDKCVLGTKNFCGYSSQWLFEVATTVGCRGSAACLRSNSM